MEEEKQAKTVKTISRPILKTTARIVIIITLILSLSSVFLVFSLKEVYLVDSSDKSFKDHKKEYEALKVE